VGVSKRKKRNGKYENLVFTTDRYTDRHAPVQHPKQSKKSNTEEALCLQTSHEHVSILGEEIAKDEAFDLHVL